MNIFRVFRTLAVPALAIALAACSDEGTTPTNSGGTGTFNGTVRVIDNQFVPRDITISAGDSVTWSFEGSNIHTVTEGAQLGNPSPLFGSDFMDSGTFGYRFTTTGSSPYHCIPHFSLDMRGAVTVQQTAGEHL